MRLSLAIALAACGAPMAEPTVANHGRPDTAATRPRDACPQGTLDGWQHEMWPACPALPFRYDVDVCNGRACPQPCRVEITAHRPDRPEHAAATVTYDARGRAISMPPLEGEYVDELHCAYDGERMTACGGDNLSRDDRGRLISVSDPTAHDYNPRLFAYDDHGRVRSETISRPHDDPDRTDFRYDASGRLIALDYVGFGIHEHTDYRYGPDGRLAETNNGYVTFHYSYDAKGRLAGSDDGRGHVAFTYDDRDRLVRDVNQDDPADSPIIHTYIYDCR